MRRRYRTPFIVHFQAMAWYLIAAILVAWLVLFGIRLAITALGSTS
jgi:hypothetical protein